MAQKPKKPVTKQAPAKAAQPAPKSDLIEVEIVHAKPVHDGKGNKWPKGSRVKFPKAEAQMLIDRGMAIPAGTENKIEAVKDAQHKHRIHQNKQNADMVMAEHDRRTPAERARAAQTDTEEGGDIDPAILDVIEEEDDDGQETA